MTADRWQQVDLLFHGAIARTGAARQAFLAESLADESIRQEVERLVRAHEAAGGFMDDPAASAAFEVLADPAFVGVHVGPYRIAREIGRGGMGTVYLAERADDQFDKQVAIKLIKRGLDTDAVLRRFRDERHILASLDHPNVARLLDAGTTGDGRPFFVMEYIDGRPIDRYCDDQRLTLERRLDLFLDVCAAVSSAHQHLVVHRDIKPSNILVTADGSPKLLDFGIAKVMHAPGAAETQLTVALMRPMTPEYASPEQLEGLASTTLGDVYSLGVLLYVLLVGRGPLRFDTRTPEAVARVVATTDPDVPSVAVIRTIGESEQERIHVDAATIAGLRRTTPERLCSQLRGDLDTIVLTALNRDPGSRYQSVERLADDIRRHRSGLPILARHPAFWYRTVKFVRRNRLAVGVAVALGVTLIVGIAATSWEAVRANRAERGARLEGARAAAVSDFLQHDLLEQASSSTQAFQAAKPDPNLTVRAALDRAAERIADKFDSDPATEAALRQTIGLTYRDLSLYAQAEPQLDRAVALRRRILGATHPDTLRSIEDLGVLYFWQGKYPAANELLVQVLDAERRQFGDHHPVTNSTRHVLGIVASALGHHAEAETLYRTAYDDNRRMLGEENPETLSELNDLVSEYINEGKYEDAADLGAQLVATKRRILGAEHPSTLLAMNNLGVVYRNLGRYAEAEKLFVTCLDTRRRVVGEDHIDTLASLNSLALVYQAEGRYAEAEPLLLEGLERRRRTLGAEHPQTIAVMNNIAELYRREGRRHDAETQFAQVLDLRRRVLGPDHPNTAAVLTSLAAMKVDERQFADAEPLLREAIAIYQKKNPEAWQRYYAESLLGRSLTDLGRPTEGEALLTSGYEGLVKRRASIPFENRAIVDDATSWRNR